MTDSGTVGEADLADRASRLFRFLARVQGIGGTPILDADDLGAVEWLGELPASTAVRFTSGSEDKPFLRLDKVPVTPPIDPPEPEVRAWLVPGPLDDHTAEPALRAERVDGGARTERLIDHPHIRAAGFLQAVDYPGLPKSAPVARAAVRLSETPGEIAVRPPTLGEHTDVVLAELGYDAAEIAALREGGVI